MSTIVVIPTYDEAASILATIDAVLTALPTSSILVVDDNSPDGTARLVDQHPSRGCRVYLLARPVKSGLGAAYRAGFAWALDAGFDAIVQMDADGSHPADRLPALVGALDEADVAVGSRYVPGGSVHDWPWSRRVISSAGNAYVRLVLGLPVRDATAGFKAFRREALRSMGALQSASEGYSFQIENTWRADRCGLSVVEVPITFTDRTAGRSKMSGSIVREALLRVATWRWHELTGEAGPDRVFPTRPTRDRAQSGAGVVARAASTAPDLRRASSSAVCQVPDPRLLP